MPSFSNELLKKTTHYTPRMSYRDYSIVLHHRRFLGIFPRRTVVWYAYYTDVDEKGHKQSFSPNFYADVRFLREYFSGTYK